MRKKDQRQFVTKADIHIANLRVGKRLLRAWRNPNWLPWGNPYLHTCPTIWMLRSILGSINSRKCYSHETYKFPSLLPHKLDFCIRPHCKIEKLVMSLRKKTVGYVQWLKDMAAQSECVQNNRRADIEPYMW